MRSIFLMGGNGRDVLESQCVHGYMMVRGGLAKVDGKFNCKHS